MATTRRLLSSAAVLGAALSLLPAQTNWQQFTTIQTTPAGREGMGLAYDSHRQHTVLYGGFLFGGSYSSETWVNDGSNWIHLTPPSSPPPLSGVDLVYDAARHRIVLFAGVNSLIGFSNQTWEFDGTFWVQRNPATSPPARAGGAHAYDLVRRRMVVFGGWNGTRMGDTWEYDGNNWTQISPVHSPSGRSDVLMAYDEGRQRMVLHGGYNDVSQYLGDTWEYDGVDWTQAVPLSSAGPLADAAITYDRGRGRIVSFGGRASWSLPRTNQTFEYDGITWTDVTSSVGASPSARWGARFVYDEARGRCVVFGGIDNFNQFPGDTWQLVTTNVARHRSLGSGCPGAAGAPQLIIDGNAMPRIGGVWGLRLQNLPASPLAFCSLGLSDTTSPLGPLPLPLASIGMPGCALYVSPDVTLYAAASAGVAHLGFAIPNQSWVLGLRLFAQGGGFEAAANAAGLILTDAARADIGW